MGFISKLIAAAKENITTSVVGFIGAVVVILNDYGLGVSPDRKTWIIAAVLAALGLVAKDGGKEGDPNA